MKISFRIAEKRDESQLPGRNETSHFEVVACPYEEDSSNERLAGLALSPKLYAPNLLI